MHTISSALERWRKLQSLVYRIGFNQLPQRICGNRYRLEVDKQTSQQYAACPRKINGYMFYFHHLNLTNETSKTYEYRRVFGRSDSRPTGLRNRLQVNVPDSQKTTGD